MTAPDGADSASFRDPDAQVIHAGRRVLRGLTEAGAADWVVLAASGLFRDAKAEGRIVPTQSVADAMPGWAVVLEHERIPVVSYPFEWTFGMLRDAALLHLDLLSGALECGMTMKDGSAYNIQWRGAMPTFIDVASFTQSPDRPWPGYEQFCQTFLNPLLLQAALGVDFHGWLRASPEGIPGTDARRVLPVLKLARRGALRHVLLQGRAAGAGRGSQAASASMSAAGFDRRVAARVARSLRKVVTRLDWDPPPSAWSDYAAANTYSPRDRHAKGLFVTMAVRRHRPSTVLDLGCHDETYARIAAECASTVVAVDADHASVEGLYRRLRDESDRTVVPLVMDVANPSPGFGWRAGERPGFADRVRPDLVLCLALVHHLALVKSIPLTEVVDWLRAFNAPVVAEFADRADPMVQRLLANSTRTYPDYGRAAFESAIAPRFEVVETAPLMLGQRQLYELRPR